MAVTENAMAANLAESLMRLRGLTGVDRIVLAEASSNVVSITLDTGETYDCEITAT